MFSLKSTLYSIHRSIFENRALVTKHIIVLCCILLQTYAPHLPVPPRLTSIEDETNLTQMFKSWGLTVETLQNEHCSIQGIKKMFNQASKSGDCFVGAILTHGTDGDQVYAYDGLFKLSDIFDTFKGDMCPQLAGKPKIFLIQACRGGDTDAGVDSKDQADDSGSSNNKVVPVEADFVYVYSAAPGYSSFKNGYGSWFVKSLKTVFDQYGRDQELNQMMRRTNRLVCDMTSNTGEGRQDHLKKQTLWFISTLRKDLYFI
eukprot:GHVT01084016.1.p1 GENE.GHVT01084016.1~~GHVT01084016.1.p1  ORF type:complete len:259 (-),score=-0.62 GHVT01084016.1:574-1350(-)